MAGALSEAIPGAPAASAEKINMRVRINGLTKQYGDTYAVHDFTTEFEDGELIALLGPSGCGKSTTLYMLAGIVPVTSGQIFFDDEDVTYAKSENRGIGLVFQNYALYPHMTVLENICFPLEIQKIPKKERIERAKRIAKQVHIDDLLNRRPSELSGGQQQRVAIARALVKRPRLLLLDEPLSNLDARLRIEMREEIRRIQQETGVTTVFVTHDQEEAMSISDHILLMRKGVVMQYDRPQELYDNPANDFVADFLGNPPINKLTGEIRQGCLCLENGDCLNHPAFQKYEDGRKLHFSVRAESFCIDEKSPVGMGRLKQTYVMGKEKLAVFALGEKEIRVYLDDTGKYKQGDMVPLGVKQNGVFIFDGESGERLK